MSGSGPPVALTVAGTDSGGGAGVAADLATFRAHRVWGACAVTAVTAQNTTGVEAVELISAATVTAQIAAVAGDLGVAATKTGMLASAAVVEAVAAAVVAWDLHPLVVDPVMVASSTVVDPNRRSAPRPYRAHERRLALLGPDGVDALRRVLLPLADLVTPNLAEAAALAGWDEPPADRAGMERVAAAVLALGPAAVLVTGGHLPGPEAPDLLAWRGPSVPWTSGADSPRPTSEESGVRWFPGGRLESAHTHGTGCVLSAAITARLARGEELIEAVDGAKRFVTAAIAAGVELGGGPGAVDPPRGGG